VIAAVRVVLGGGVNVSHALAFWPKPVVTRSSLVFYGPRQRDCGPYSRTAQRRRQ
jgi:hypothetical protein